MGATGLHRGGGAGEAPPGTEFSGRGLSVSHKQNKGHHGMPLLDPNSFICTVGVIILIFAFAL